MKGEGKYTESFGVSAQIGEIYRRCQDIYSNQGDIQKVSGYLPKSGRYTESFRIINSYAADSLVRGAAKSHLSGFKVKLT